MTVLNYSEVVNFSRQELWRFIAEFAKCPRYLHWVEKAEPVSGNPAAVGSVWRFHIATSAGLWRLEAMISEWLADERFALRPLESSALFHGTEFFQIIVDLTDKPNHHTQINICCEYKPANKLGRLKNLFLQRRHGLELMQQSVDALSLLASAKAWKATGSSATKSIPVKSPIC